MAALLYVPFRYKIWLILQACELDRSLTTWNHNEGFDTITANFKWLLLHSNRNLCSGGRDAIDDSFRFPRGSHAFNNRSWACLYIDKAMSLCLEKDVDLSTYHKAVPQTTLTECEPAFTVAHVSVCSFMMASAINMRSFMQKASSLGHLCVHENDVIDVHCILLSPSICLL